MNCLLRVVLLWLLPRPWLGIESRRSQLWDSSSWELFTVSWFLLAKSCAVAMLPVPWLGIKKAWSGFWTPVAANCLVSCCLSKCCVFTMHSEWCLRMGVFFRYSCQIFGICGGSVFASCKLEYWGSSIGINKELECLWIRYFWRDFLLDFGVQTGVGMEVQYNFVKSYDCSHGDTIC